MYNIENNKTFEDDRFQIRYNGDAFEIYNKDLRKQVSVRIEQSEVDSTLDIESYMLGYARALESKGGFDFASRFMT